MWICVAEAEFTGFAESIGELARIKSSSLGTKTSTSADATIRVAEGIRRARLAGEIFVALRDAVSSWPEDGNTAYQVERTSLSWLKATECIRALDDSPHLHGDRTEPNQPSSAASAVRRANPTGTDKQCTHVTQTLQDQNTEKAETSRSYVDKRESGVKGQFDDMSIVRHSVTETDSHTHTHAVAYHLSHDQQIQRWEHRVFKTLRAAIKHNRSLFGHHIKSIHDAFHSIDTKRTGRLDFEEYRRAMRRLDIPLSDEQLREVFELVDEDNDGYIEWREFANEIHRHVRHHRIHHPVPELQPHPEPEPEPEPEPVEPEPEPEPEPVEPEPELEAAEPVTEKETVAAHSADVVSDMDYVPSTLHAAMRRRGGYDRVSWSELLQDAARCGIAVPVGLQRCEENWAWLVAAVDGARCHCIHTERELLPRRHKGENSLYDGVPMSKSRNIRAWEMDSWGRLSISRIQAWEETRQMSANANLQAKRLSKRPLVAPVV